MTQVIVRRLVATSPTAMWQLTRPRSLVNRAFLRRAWGVAWSLGVVGVVEWALWTISAPKFRVRKDREGGVTQLGVNDGERQQTLSFGWGCGCSRVGVVDDIS